MPTHRRLTAEQEQHFLQYGFIQLSDAFDPEFIRSKRALAWERLGMSETDPATWTEERLHMSSSGYWRWSDIAPDAWELMCDLMGGVERTDPDARTGDGMVMNFRQGSDKPWVPPSPEANGWHKDGNFFRHYLDSPEQALLCIIIWKDIEPRGGGTFFAPDSVGVIARHMLAHPEGLKPGEFGFKDLIAQCHDFRELTGKAGDLFIMHPFMLHSISYNHAGTPRMITNPVVRITEPFQFNRPDPADFSVLERSILGALGVDRLDFQIQGEREHYKPNHTAAFEEYLKKRNAS